MHRLVAAFAWTLHILFVAFAVLGGFLAWVLPWVVLPHLASALWGARMAIWRPRCPLSIVENWGRVGAGREGLHDEGFVAHYFEGRLYPKTWARRIELLVSTLVLGSWLGFALR
ncbi:hypothetical protein NSZ01_00480 [Nocardioides szechwanensis]|uniref:DUF2784 domain-containing protein n=1 Tax=Nocardioides szechwanensis TaxID=1005944 RepID=A0A1G9XL43_9ACTN|nr:DUF2784 domain-containing protein [Nocardioides szechwanensis]GEP32280.1 hypothetical protein NSZ01_00480 [Nocardioides szechwanensis]SDM97478.1 Protein of Unknown function [Nocardioides szechwanensis]